MILRFIFIAICLFLFKNFLYYYFNPFKKFLGQDKIMFEGYPYCYLSLECIFSKSRNDNFQFVKNKINKIIEDNTSLLRLNIKHKEKQYYYNKQDSETICNKILKEIDDNVDISNLYKPIIENKNEVNMYIGSKRFIFLGNHTIFDGLSAFKLCASLFDVKKEELPLVYKIEYIPFVTELKMLHGLLNSCYFVKRNLTHIHQREYPDMVKYHFLQTQTSLIKNHSKEHNVAFISTICGFSIFNLFENTNKNVNILHVAITAAFISNNRFNNFGVILIEVKRDLFFNIVQNINKQLLKRKNMAYSTFILSNIWNFHLNKSGIDVIFSALPLTKNIPIKFNNIDVKQLNIRNRNSSTPVYIAATTNYDKIDISYSIRSPDISFKTEEVSDETNKSL